MTTTRRDFLKSAMGAVAAFQAAGSKRREVSVGRRRVRVVDVHGHFVAPETLEIVKNTKLAPNITNNLNGPLILAPSRLQAMDDAGIDLQVLTHQGGWWYEAERSLAGDIVRAHNEHLAKWIQMHPDRFAGLASVSVQHPDLAAQQLEDGVKRLRLRGAHIGGHAGGVVPSSEKYDPFWAKVQELDVPVFVHPAGAENLVKENSLAGRGDLGNIIGNPLETTFFLSRMILDGALDRFPRVKICAAHAGGFLPSYLGRTDVACQVRPNANCANKRRPHDYFRDQILVDSMVFTDEGLRHLVAEMGAGQIVFGTDIPYGWPAPVDLILKASFLSEREKEAILGANILKLLRIS